MSYKIAVLGATSHVAHELFTVFGERNFPASDVIALASEKSSGHSVAFGDKDIGLTPVDAFDFKGVDVVFSVGSAKLAAAHAPRAVSAGAVVIDASSHFRLDPDVPLVVPEVNRTALAGYKIRNIISSPDPAVVLLSLALKPLHDAGTISRVVVSTYQAVSDAGREAMDELFNQTRTIFMNNTPQVASLPKRIAFNVIPQVGDFMDDRSTATEWSMAAETKKILGSSIRIHAHCTTVPVFVGHGQMVNVECVHDMDALTARSLWLKTPGITLIDLETDMGYVTPADVQGEDSVYISRSRDDITVDNGLSFWCVGDNVRKGAALNAVQIAEILIKEHF